MALTKQVQDSVRGNGAYIGSYYHYSDTQRNTILLLKQPMANEVANPISFVTTHHVQKICDTVKLIA